MSTTQALVRGTFDLSEKMGICANTEFQYCVCFQGLDQDQNQALAKFRVGVLHSPKEIV